jgi:hypothetical protein
MIQVRLFQLFLIMLALAKDLYITAILPYATKEIIVFTIS